ncbi:uncharacterized protein LOC129569785 [Sitodiplosis mosellana]|uniref:uncharacterized protein LOC129569785 n=1 Tax=Sitodiplosis mosellana TaxID=263140 RepID=UPI002444ED42|nr:uncharacterized protein LOC129569785 [Sitodiplosis mosellana]
MENATSSKATNLEQILQQTGLNEDCLVNIFKCLSGCDLVTLCDLDYENDTSLTDLINDRVISSLKIYDFGRLPASHVFRYFGRSLQRFKLRIQAFSVFLENVIRYCQAPSRLREVILVVDTDCPGFNFDDDLWDQVQPMFQNLVKLNIIHVTCRRAYYFMPEFFGELDDNDNLKTVTLEHFYRNKTWMEFLPNPQMCANITELRLMNIRLKEGMNEFQEILDRLPNLR